MNDELKSIEGLFQDIQENDPIPDVWDELKEYFSRINDLNKNPFEGSLKDYFKAIEETFSGYSDNDIMECTGWYIND